MQWFELVTLVLVPVAILAVAVALMLPRLYRSAQADRREKNGHHLATALTTILVLAAVVPLEVYGQRLFSGALIAFLALIIPIRTSVVELGIRRRRRQLPQLPG